MPQFCFTWWSYEMSFEVNAFDVDMGYWGHVMGARFGYGGLRTNKCCGCAISQVWWDQRALACLPAVPSRLFSESSWKFHVYLSMFIMEFFYKFRSATWKVITYLSRNDAAPGWRRRLQSCLEVWLVGATGTCNDCKAQWWPSTSVGVSLWCVLLIQKCSYTVIMSNLLNDTFVNAEALFCFFSTFYSPQRGSKACVSFDGPAE